MSLPEGIYSIFGFVLTNKISVKPAGWSSLIFPSKFAIWIYLRLYPRQAHLFSTHWDDRRWKSTEPQLWVGLCLEPCNFGLPNFDMFDTCPPWCPLSSLFSHHFLICQRFSSFWPKFATLKSFSLLQIFQQNYLFSPLKSECKSIIFSPYQSF